MVTIDSKLEKLTADCPILLDRNFQREHPGILGVAGFLDAAATTHYEIEGKYEPFDSLGVDNTADYIKLVHNGNSEAVKTYKKIRNLLNLG